MSLTKATTHTQLGAREVADNVTHTVVSNLKHNLPALGLKVERIFVRDQNGDETLEAEMIGNQDFGQQPMNWMIEFTGFATVAAGTAFVYGAADVGRRIRAVQAMTNSHAAYQGWLDLVCKLCTCSIEQAEGALLESPVLIQAAVNHLRAIDLQGLTAIGGTEGGAPLPAA